MGKASSMWGKTKGKVGGLVYAISGGEQIVREYNPNVANPSTVDQMNQRAKLKLMSQMSAALAPVIAMTKTGLVSARNKFVKLNSQFAYAVDGVAQVSYENMQLTEGNLGLPMINGDVGDSTMWAYFQEEPSPNIKRVVWCLFRKTEEGTLEYINSVISSERENDTHKPGHTCYFLANVMYIGGVSAPTVDYVLYAYGIVDTSAQATVNYGNLSVADATDIANLVANRKIAFTDYQLTQTRGSTWQRGATAPQYSGTAIQPNQVRIFVTATNGGTVTGGGVYTIGDTATLQATAASGYAFVRWTRNGGASYSTNNPLSLEVSEQLDLVAVFQVSGNNDSL